MNAFGMGWGNLQGAILWLTGALLAIEIVMIGIWWALGGGERIVSVMKKLMYLLVWLWIVQSFPTLAKAFAFSLAEAGEIAGGQPGTHDMLMDPSSIINLGLNITKPLADVLGEQGILDIADGVAYAIMWLLSMLAFVIIAWQMFYCVLEFYLILALVGILLPFGFFEPTKFLAEKSIGAVIASGVKLMVLSFIVAVSMTIMAGLPIPTDIPDLETGITMVMICGAIAFLAWNAPGVAAGLVAGSPSLSASTGVQNTMAAGIVAGGAALAAGSAAKYAGTKVAAMAGSAGQFTTQSGQMAALENAGGMSGGNNNNGPGSPGSSSPNSSTPGGGSSGMAAGGKGSGSDSSAPSSGGGDKSGAPGWSSKAMHAARQAVPDEARPSGGNVNPKL